MGNGARGYARSGTRESARLVMAGSSGGSDSPARIAVAGAPSRFASARFAIRGPGCFTFARVAAPTRASRSAVRASRASTGHTPHVTPCQFRIDDSFDESSIRESERGGHTRPDQLRDQKRPRPQPFIGTAVTPLGRFTPSASPARVTARREEKPQ